MFYIIYMILYLVCFYFMYHYHRLFEIELQVHNLGQIVWIKVNWVITASGNIRHNCLYVNERYVHANVFFSNLSGCSMKVFNYSKTLISKNKNKTKRITVLTNCWNHWKPHNHIFIFLTTKIVLLVRLYLEEQINDLVWCLERLLFYITGNYFRKPSWTHYQQFEKYADLTFGS